MGISYNKSSLFTGGFEEKRVEKDKIIVANPKVGDKVVRGRDWEWEDQDANSVYGIVRRIYADGKWAEVEWVYFLEDGTERIHYGDGYRIGDRGNFDLYYY